MGCGSLLHDGHSLVLFAGDEALLSGSAEGVGAHQHDVHDVSHGEGEDVAVGGDVLLSVVNVGWPLGIASQILSGSSPKIKRLGSNIFKKPPILLATSLKYALLPVSLREIEICLTESVLYKNC